MKAFVIAIQELPASVQIAERCINSGKKFDLAIKMFPAVTPGKSLKEFLNREKIPTDLFYDQWSKAENAMACFASHYTLWERAFMTREEILIFEHDAVIKEPIPFVPYKGVLSYGHPSYGKFNTPSQLGVNKAMSKPGGYLPGAHAYIVKPEAARKLIVKAKENARPTDIFLNSSDFDFIEEYYPWPVVVEEHFSTVQQYSGCMAKHQYKKNPDTYSIISV